MLVLVIIIVYYLTISKCAILLATFMSNITIQREMSAMNEVVRACHKNWLIFSMHMRSLSPVMAAWMLYEFITDCKTKQLKINDI